MDLDLTDLLAMVDLPISTWIDAVDFDMASDNEDDTSDVTLLAYGSSILPSAITTTPSAKALTSELFLMRDITMLDLDEVPLWGGANDELSLDPTTTPTKECLSSVDGSWITIQLGDTVVVAQNTAESSIESPKKNQEQPSSPTRTPQAVVTKKSTKKELLTSTSPPATRTRQRKLKVTTPDPTVRVYQRKCKQRSYEREYRGRLRDQRSQTKFEWLHYEAELRQVLSRKRALVLPPQEDPKAKEVDFVQLIHEEHALTEERVYLHCITKWLEVLNVWGFETKAIRNNHNNRFEINAMPQVRGIPEFTDFSW